MIQAKIAPYTKVLVVFDTPQHKIWSEYNRVTSDGIGVMASTLECAGIKIATEVSFICLCDSKAAKAIDFKDKLEYVNDIIETHAFNVVVPVGAKSFEKIMGHKGIDKYLTKVIKSDVYNCKVIPCPNPSIVRYKPDMKQVLLDTAALIKKEMETDKITIEEKVPTKYYVIDTIKKFDKLMEVIGNTEDFAFDLETSGFQFNVDKILTMQYTHQVGYSYLVPTDFYGQDECSNVYWTSDQWNYIVRKTRELFNNITGNKHVVGHNVKFDLKFMCHWFDIDMPNPENIVDTMVLSFLVNENTPNDLKSNTCLFTDMGDYEFELEDWKTEYCRANKLKKGDFSYSLIPFDVLVPYAQADTDATYRLYEYFFPEMVKEGQEKVFAMLMKFLYTAAKLEMTGWSVDIEYAEEYLIELTERIEIKEQELAQLPEVVSASKILEILELIKDNEKRVTKITELKTPFVFNFNSTAHKRTLFFDIMNMPIIKYTKAVDAEGNRSTPSIDKEVIETWGNSHPEYADFFDHLKEYSEMCKIKSTYVEAIIEKHVNGRIYPTYNIIGAKTGRLSSSNPNLQNIPAHSVEAKKVKRIFQPPEDDWVMLGADLSAAEMRYACVCSGDKLLTDIFNAGVDIHGAIAKEVFNLDCHPNEVKVKYPEIRDIAKTIQFLSLYGGGADTLATKVKIKKKRAQQILDKIALGLPGAPQVESPNLSVLKDNCAATNSLVDMFQFTPAKAEDILAAKDKVGALIKGFTITKGRAQEILDTYFEKYVGVDRYIKNTILFANTKGYSLSALGRKRRVPEVNSTDNGVIERGLRQAVNATIQSIASDGLMLSAYSMMREIEETGETRIRMMGPIHDAIYCEVRRDYLLEGRDLLIKHMSKFPDALEVTIPMLSSAEWGRNWKEFDEEFGESLVVGADLVEEQAEEENAA